MTFKTTNLRDAICFALAMGASAAAFAQQPVAPAADERQDAETTELDRIQVTGSRIRQVDVETAQPVTFITRDDLQKQGFQSIADVLQNLSAVGSPFISRAAPLSAGQDAGGSFISLRNLGSQRTLVLLNGRRLPISTGGRADISKIPTAAIERVEVLKDGASSIYGSDAIGGVINFITRSGFEGAEASAYFGQYSEGDGDTTRGELVMGFTGEKGSLTAAAEWREEDPVYARDRPYSAFPRSDLHPTDNWTPTSEFGGFTPTAAQCAQFPNAVGCTAATPLVLRRGGDPRNRGDYVLQNTVVGTCVGRTVEQGCLPGSTLDKTNTNLQTDIRTGVKSKSLYLDGILNITDNVRFRTNMLYNNRFAERTVAGYPFATASFPSTISAQSYFNPTNTPGGTPTPISNFFRRTTEVPRVSDSDATDYIFSGALEGNFEWADRVFDWDVNYLYNESRVVQASYGNLNLANLRASIGPSFLNTLGQVQCGTAAAPIAGCVPFNPFLPNGRVGLGGLTGNTALQDYLFQEEHNTGKTTTEIFSANIAGTIFALPAGDFGFAAGVERRKEKGEFVPDALAVTGGSTNLSAGPTRGGYDINEVYAELQIPILADLPFARELSVNLASRYSDFDTFGETTNNKFALKWKPFDSLLIRATAADGFRAPTIFDLYGGTSQTFPQITDPCDTSFGASASNPAVRANCINGVGGNGALGALGNTYRQLGQGFVPAGGPNTQTPVPFTSGANPALLPELSKSQNIGFVWSPTFAEGLNIGLDWWKIRIAEVIVADAPNTILSDCYVQGIASRCIPTLFTRDAARGFPVVSFGQRNAGFQKVEGFDFDISYRWRTENWGNFKTSLNSTYTSQDVFVATNDPRFAISSVGSAFSPRIRATGTLSWDMGPVGISWSSRYFSSMFESCTYFAGANGGTVEGLECDQIQFAPDGRLSPTGEPLSTLRRRRHVGSHTFNDVQVRVNTPWDATVTLGANNVFEKEPSVMYTQPNANSSFNGTYDIGRFLYMKYTQRF